MENDKKYIWEVSLVCSPMFINTSNHTKGFIERVSLNGEAKNELSANPDTLKKAEIFAHQGVWQDTLSLVASMKELQPQQWKELLISVGLDDLIDKELISE